MALDLVQLAGTICLLWSVGIFCVQLIGISQLFRNYSKNPRPPISTTLPNNEVPHVTVIRPVKGIEAGLYECITSIFKQDYPVNKLSIRLCVAEKSDPAYPILCRIATQFSEFDVQVLVEEEDPVLHGVNGNINHLGPNPKIRNISRAYREAPGDLIWIADCNVWVGPGVTGRMVDKLMGFRAGGERGPQYKFVHQLPLLVDIEKPLSSTAESLKPLLAAANGSKTASSYPSSYINEQAWFRRVWANGGGRLDEMFMATTHSKFYSAINTVAVAPCIVGKSNMFRKSQLDMLTDPAQNPQLHSQGKYNRPTGIDYFSMFICEDHLIGDTFWRANIPGFLNHGMCLGDLAIQPASAMTVSAYMARRARWLRARKWTVLAATLIEPGVESLLCCGAFSYAATTLPWFAKHLGIPPTGTAQLYIWLSLLFGWMLCDYLNFSMLHSGDSVEIDHDTPVWARGTRRPGGHVRRGFGDWLFAWIGRELLALPVWTYAVLLGTTVNWRGKLFRVRMDMSVVELEKQCLSSEFKSSHAGSGTRTPQMEMGRPGSSSSRAD
ncbi:hypothetical protein TD95_005278 [Thielaviopsis punctulata]|uniref:Ceramide glucosyltransferase n=1 Tax=Thielaviopsis punctulata TaxID=72032 RepID=A0A0F4ZJB7_9PEZI|nr:hypothetical protein TD95_005278 [Thielaviopsis punctulata]